MPSNSQLDAAQARLISDVTREFTALKATNTTTPEPEPEPTPAPAPAPAPSVTGATAVATADNLVVFRARVAGVRGLVTFRASATALAGQAGYPAQTTLTADGDVELVIEDVNDTDPKFWQFELGGNATASSVSYGSVLAKGSVTQQPVPTAPTPTPGTGSGGSGGALTDRTFQSFRDAAGLTGQYHVYASGLDWSKTVGLLFYCDGTGDYGLQNPTSSYLLGGATGLIAVARKHNMVLVTPIPPGGKCDGASGTCWYQDSGAVAQGEKVQWSAELMKLIFSQYNLDRSRVAWGGYSSGAEWTSYWFTPDHADSMIDGGVSVAISYGGAGSWIQPSWGAAFKANVAMVWDVGSADTAALPAARNGEAYYRGQGFKTELNIVQGLAHSRPSTFGPVMDREITQHVKPTAAR